MKSGTYVYSLLSRLQREGLSMKWLQGKNRDLSIIILSPDLTNDWTSLFQVWYLLDQSPWRPRIWLQEPGWWNAEQVLATDPGCEDATTITWPWQVGSELCKLLFGQVRPENISLSQWKPHPIMSRRGGVLSLSATLNVLNVHDTKTTHCGSRLTIMHLLLTPTSSPTPRTCASSCNPRWN